MKLYVIRHGQSEGNIRGVFSGWHQHNLTEKGREDACRAGRIISKVKFDKVYSSDLYRAIETAKIALPDYECEPTPLIKEINVGLLQEMTYEKAREKYGHLYKKPNGNDYGEIVSGNLNIPETEYPMLYTRKDKYMIESLTDLEVLTKGLE